MSLPNGSASASDRTIGCPASIALPQAYRSSEYADRGHGLHAFIRSVLSGTPVDRAIEAVDPEHRDTCRNIEWHKLGGDLTEIRCEASYALDPVARSARFLGLDIRRDYGRFGLGPDEVPGSLDIEGPRFDEIPVVVDIKTGYLPVAEASENGQGLFFGAVKHILLDAPEVEFRVVRLAPSGKVRLESSAVYTALELDTYMSAYAAALDLAREARRVLAAGGTPDVHVGDWCHFCEAMESCPAYSRLARSMLSEAASLEQRVGALTLDQAGQAWLMASQIEAMLKRVWAALEARARVEPLPSTPGKVVRAVPFQRQDFSRQAALEMLRTLGATPDMIASLYRTTTSEMIRETRDPSAPKAKRSRRAA